MAKNINKEIWLFVILLIISITAIIFSKPVQEKPQEPQDIVFGAKITGCAETDAGMATRAAGETREPSVFVKDYDIIYNRAIEHQCCRKVELMKEVSKNEIKITENWSGPGCRCICYSKIEAKLSNVAEGTYTVNVYEEGINPDNTLMEKKLIVSKTVRV